MMILGPALVLGFCLMGADPAAAADPVLAAHEADPRNGIPIYLIARSHARKGDAAAAAEWLSRLLDLEWDHDVDPDDFASVADDAAFRRIAAALDARAARVGAADVAVAFQAQDLVPEGIAWDPRSDTFLVSSGHSRKVLAVARDGSTRDRTQPAAGGAFAVGGLRVDEARGHLWAASTAAPFMAGFTPQAAGQSRLVRYDLASGRPQRSWSPPQSGALLNDVAVDSDGTAYVTDTAHGAVLRTTPGDVLASLLPADTFVGPNGIALAREGDGLFVADFDGISFVELPNGRVRRIASPPGVRLGGIDGLYVQQSRLLVGVQNLVGRGRVWRLQLDDALTRVTRAEVLLSGHPGFRNPTTAAIVRDELYLLANPHLQAPRPDGGLTPMAAGARYEILRIPLGQSTIDARRPDAASLRATFEAWMDAWNRRDIPAIAQIGGGFGFGRDVPFARRGAADRASYERGLAGYMDLMEVVGYQAHHTEVEVFGETGLVWGFYEQTTQQKAGPLRTVYGRQSLTFLWRDGGWRLVFYHRSALPNEFVR